MLKFLRISWLSLLLLNLTILLIVYRYGGYHPPADLVHNARICTYYCETTDCSHRAHISTYHPLIRLQVVLLKGISASYGLANIVIYYGFLLGFWLWAGVYLLGIGKAKWPVSELFLLLGFAGGFVYWVLPTHTERLFNASVFLCLEISHRTMHSLYDVYLGMFGFIIPGLTVGLLLVVALKCLWNYKYLSKFKFIE